MTGPLLVDPFGRPIASKEKIEQIKEEVKTLGVSVAFHAFCALTGIHPKRGQGYDWKAKEELAAFQGLVVDMLVGFLGKDVLERELAITLSKGRKTQDRQGDAGGVSLPSGDE